MKLFPDRLFRDVIPPAGVAFADYVGVTIPVEDTFLCAYVLTPDGTHKRPCPCVILCHGFPGFYKSDDIAQSLCRMGCVVIVPGCRGGGAVVDSIPLPTTSLILLQPRNGPAARKSPGPMALIPKSILLSGHSMGGSSAPECGATAPLAERRNCHRSLRHLPSLCRTPLRN